MHIYLSILTALLFALSALALKTRQIGKGSSGFRSWCCLAATLLVGLALAANLTLAGYFVVMLVGGQPAAETRQLRPGISYQRRVTRQPARVAHIISIEPGGNRKIAFSPPIKDEDGWYHAANTVSETLKSQQGILAMNASFFDPFHDWHPLDYYPRVGDAVNPVGVTIWEGKRYANAALDWPILAIDEDGTLQVLESRRRTTRYAVSGNCWLIRDGQIVRNAESRRYPRTAVGLNRDTQAVWLVVVDGKQPGYSLGMTLRELSELLKQLGATDAINLDGGGSTTLAFRQDSQVQLLNRPCHTKIPHRQRPVANCLIVTEQESN